jgi:hypothetical protein
MKKKSATDNQDNYMLGIKLKTDRWCNSLPDLSEKRCNAFHFWVILHNENGYSGKKRLGNDRKICTGCGVPLMTFKDNIALRIEHYDILIEKIILR